MGLNGALTASPIMQIRQATDAVYALLCTMPRTYQNFNIVSKRRKNSFNSLSQFHRLEAAGPTGSLSLFAWPTYDDDAKFQHTKLPLWICRSLGANHSEVRLLPSGNLDGLLSASRLQLGIHNVLLARTSHSPLRSLKSMTFAPFRQNSIQHILFCQYQSSLYDP